MQPPNDNQMIFVHAIHSIYNHYQALLEKKTKWLFALEYDQKTIHFVNLFLKQFQFVHFNFDGSLNKIGFSLPEDAQLLTLITEYSYRYHLNGLATTLDNLKLIAKLPISMDQDRQTEKPTFLYYTGPLQRKGSVSGYSKAPEEMISPPFRPVTVAKQMQEPPKPTPPLGPEQYMSHFELSGDTYSPPTKIRVSTWEPEKFARAVRLLYDFYAEKPNAFFTRQNLFDHANLKQFTAAVNENAEVDVLRIFNNFLVYEKFIKQKNDILKSITITQKPFPKEDLELQTLFSEFKVEHYRKRLPSKRSNIGFQQPQTKPAATALNKASIHFIISDTDETEQYCPH